MGLELRPTGEGHQEGIVRKLPHFCPVNDPEFSPCTLVSIKRTHCLFSQSVEPGLSWTNSLLCSSSSLAESCQLWLAWASFLLRLASALCTVFSSPTARASVDAWGMHSKLDPTKQAHPQVFGRERTTLNPKARKPVPVFWATFSPVRRGLFPVVRDFLCIIPTEQVLYYRNLGLYYGLASGTLPLYSGPCLGVKGGCVSCEVWYASAAVTHPIPTTQCSGVPPQMYLTSGSFGGPPSLQAPLENCL